MRMRQFLLVLMSLFVMTCFAEEGYSTCKISSSEYVEATAYVNLNKSTLSGNLVITNHATSPLQTASISVVVYYSYSTKEYKAYEGEVEVTHEGSVTLYNSRWTGLIPNYRSESISLSRDKVIPYSGYNGRITSINVSINNAVCK